MTDTQELKRAFVREEIIRMLTLIYVVALLASVLWVCMRWAGMQEPSVAQVVDAEFFKSDEVGKSVPVRDWSYDDWGCDLEIGNWDGDGRPDCILRAGMPEWQTPELIEQRLSPSAPNTKVMSERMVELATEIAERQYELAGLLAQGERKDDLKKLADFREQKEKDAPKHYVMDRIAFFFFGTLCALVIWFLSREMIRSGKFSAELAIIVFVASLGALYFFYFSLITPVLRFWG